MKNKIKEKVLKEIKKDSNLELFHGHPEVLVAIDLTLAEVGKVIDTFTDNVYGEDKAFDEIRDMMEELKQKLGIK